MVILILPSPLMPHSKDRVHAGMVLNPWEADGLLKKLPNANILTVLN